VIVLKITWSILICGILIATLLMDLTARLDYSGEGSICKRTAAYHFGYLIEFSLPSAQIPRPILFVQVINKTRFFETVLGIGYIRLPTTTGIYNLVVSTIKPLGSRNDNLLRTSLHHYYFGLQKLDMRSLISMYTGSRNQRECVVQSSGSVNIRLEII